MTVTLDVLPAAHGDALVITYGPAGGEHRILVDGGPAPTYADGLRTHLAGLDAAARHFELAIVTHIDADHIDGSLILFQDHDLGLEIDDVWFNGWPQVAAADGAAAAADRRLRRRRPGRAAGRVPHPPALDAGLEHDRRRQGRDPRPRPPHRSARVARS